MQEIYLCLKRFLDCCKLLIIETFHNEIVVKEFVNLEEVGVNISSVTIFHIKEEIRCSVLNKAFRH